MNRNSTDPIAAESPSEPNRREFLVGLAGTAALASLAGTKASAQTNGKVLNIARVAIPSSIVIRSENKVGALNDGFAPVDSFDRSHGVYGLWGDRESHSPATWVQYNWSGPVTINHVEVFWAVDHSRPGVLPGSSQTAMRVPDHYRVLYWDGKDFVPVSKAQGLGLAQGARPRARPRYLQLHDLRCGQDRQATP
jgi:hypothetical protein